MVVVPIPRYAGSLWAFWKTTWLANSIASRRRRTKFVSLTLSTVLRLSKRRLGTVTLQSWLATSPHASPPMPSATRKSVPMGPKRWLHRAGVRVTSPVVRLQTTKLSSLFLRTFPTSDIPKTLTLIAPIPVPDVPLTTLIALFRRSASRPTTLARKAALQLHGVSVGCG